MSTQASLFAAYFGVGLVLMILAFISKRAKRGLEVTDPLIDAGPLAAGVLILIALLWPAWLIWLLCSTDEETPPR